MPELTRASLRLLENNSKAPGYTASIGQVSNYIQQAAIARGVDPNVALAVYEKEGLTNWQSTFTRRDGSREQSFGPYQLYTGGGLGNDFQKDLGLDPRLPEYWRQNVDFSLNYAAANGWSKWNGFKNTEYASQGFRAGISDSATQVRVSTYTGSGNPNAQPASSLPNAQSAGTTTAQENQNAVRQTGSDSTNTESTEAVKFQDAPGTAQGIPIQDESGTLSNIRRNPETGELYDATGLYDDQGKPVFRQQGDTQAVEVVSTRILSQPNPLLDYDSYTYGISLHTIDINSFNLMVNNPGGYKPIDSNGYGTVLIASGGRRNKDLARSPYWGEDFFFENVKMNSVINTTKANRNTNAVTVDFTIIEPNSFTFLERLIGAVTFVGGQNYLQHPYVLQIDFYGNKNGVVEGQLLNQTKRIPIRLVTIKSKHTAKGVEYQISAVPYNHQAFNEVNVISPSDFTIRAQTLQEVFNGNTANIEAENRDREGSSQTSIVAAPATYFRASGFCDGYNEFYQNLTRGQGYGYTNSQVTKISVKFLGELANAKLLPDSGPTSVQNAPAPVPNAQNDKSNIQQSGGAAKNQLRFDGTQMTIPMGTKIDALIDFVVRNSEYNRKNDAFNVNSGRLATDPTAKQSQLQTPVRWWKIVPSLKILEYDVASERYCYEMIYYVKPFLKAGSHPNGPLGRANGLVKEYNYLFSGGKNPANRTDGVTDNLSNQNVIDLQIDFQMLYFQNVTVFAEKFKMGTTGKVLGDSQISWYDDGAACKPVPPAIRPDTPYIPYSAVQPMSTKFISSDGKLLQRKGASVNSIGNASDLSSSLTHNALGDMINVKLKIIGDPEFIKQDDVFYVQAPDEADGLKTPNGSLFMDKNELYVYLNFQSPTDYDESTGLARPKEGMFSQYSGVYKIILIDNSFNRGKFEQTLDLARLPIEDSVRTLDTGVQQRTEIYRDQGLGQQRPFDATRYSGPAVLTLQGGGGVRAAAALTAQQVAAGGNALLQGIASQVTQIISGQVQQLVSKTVGGIVKKGVDEVKYLVNKPSEADWALQRQAEADGLANGLKETPAFDALSESGVSTEWVSAGEMDLATLDFAPVDSLETLGSFNIDADDIEFATDLAAAAEAGELTEAAAAFLGF